MLQRFPLKRIAMVAALLCATSAWAASTVAQADVAARKALSLSQYSAVVKSYDGFEASELNEQSFYRLAIAQQRLGLSFEAKKSLDQALAKNPSGSFASSPERLALLKDDIQNGLVRIASAPGVPELGEKLIVEAKTLAVSVAVDAASPVAAVSGPAAVAVPVEVAATAPVAAVPVVTDSSLISQAQAPINTTLFLPVSSTNLAASTAVFFLTLILGGAAGWSLKKIQAGKTIAQLETDITFGRAAAQTEKSSLLAWAGEEVKNSRDEVLAESGLIVKQLSQTLQSAELTVEQQRQKVVALQGEVDILKSKPVSDVGDLVALRNELIKMRELIAVADTTDSLLYRAIDALEPVVAMEIGRNHFRLSRDPGVLVASDREKLASVMQLEPTPMNLDGAEPQAVMGYVSSAPDRFLKALGLKVPAAPPERRVRAA